jgi:SAM-dependent methyltransferase
MYFYHGWIYNRPVSERDVFYWSANRLYCGDMALVVSTRRKRAAKRFFASSCDEERDKKEECMNESQLYELKSNDYFDNVRRDILSLLPRKINRLLEVGCGSGNTLSYIKNNYRCDWACGVEFVHEAAEIARSKVDLVIEGDIENLDLPIEPATLDVILCLDVLEHLTDPWEVISKLRKFLRYNGVIIASVPNVRHIRVVFPLIFQGKWEYSNTGLLDKTHLRFFTRDTAIKLMESSGLKVDMIKETGIDASKNRFGNLVTFSMFKHFFIMQYLIRATNHCLNFNTL